MAHPEQVCLIRLSAIGDCCHTVPVLRRLQAAWPQTRFCWIIGAAEATLLGDIDGVEFIVFNKSKGLAAYSDVRRALRNKRFDLLLHMHASMRANLVSRLVSAPVRLGFDRARARDYQWLFSNQKIAAETGQHAMDALLGFARHLGVTEQTLRWDIPIAADDYAVADQHCQPQKKMMLISPCSSQRFRNHRNWDAIRYAEVASYAIEQHQMQVILTGGNTTLEAEYAQQIVELTGHPITNLVGQTNLKQLLALIDRAFVVLCP
ncbi:MAG: glycosyltransferase family 9 protein, partial [Gammaproteobacteria bacterium]|nr:glycosyltransferase family 9 protein [Gammaproteobacteria bacterium]